MKRNEVNLISFACPSFIHTRSKVVHQVQALCQVPAIAGLRRCASSKSRTSSKLSTRAKVLRQVQGRAPGPRRCTRVKSRSRSRRRSRSKAQHQDKEPHQVKESSAAGDYECPAEGKPRASQHLRPPPRAREGACLQLHLAREELPKAKASFFCKQPSFPVAFSCFATLVWGGFPSPLGVSFEKAAPCLVCGRKQGAFSGA